MIPYSRVSVDLFMLFKNLQGISSAILKLPVMLQVS